MHYYNEFEPYAAAWLRNLQEAGHIPAGRVDERSVVDVQAKDLEGIGQAHFFAGIGGWPLALRIAGWPVDLPVWTASCPCQPFSVAGKAGGVGDERHLWPTLLRLIAECRPSVVFGEQVASADGRAWLAGVRVDLERHGYAVGAADLCAAGVGAPHIRQRLYWVADAGSQQTHAADAGGLHAESRGGGIDGGLGDANREREGTIGEIRERASTERAGSLDRLADADAPRRPRSAESHEGRDESAGNGRLGEPIEPRLEGHARHGDDGHEPGRDGAEAAGSVAEAGRDGGMGNSDVPRRQAFDGIASGDEAQPQRTADAGPWSASRVIPCQDGKHRRVPLEPELFPMAPRISGRVGLLRGAGNAIVPPLAAEFVKAYMDARGIV